jgi:hypothetical protein
MRHESSRIFSRCLMSLQNQDFAGLFSIPTQLMTTCKPILLDRSRFGNQNDFDLIKNFSQAVVPSLN